MSRLAKMPKTRPDADPPVEAASLFSASVVICAIVLVVLGMLVYWYTH